MKERGLSPTPNLAKLEHQVATWNAQVQIGDTVRYYPVRGEGEFRLRNTRGAAFILSGHTAVVFLEGERGCVALDNCIPEPKEEPHA